MNNPLTLFVIVVIAIIMTCLTIAKDIENSQIKVKVEHKVKAEQLDISK
jgi:hypothetical protein